MNAIEIKIRPDASLLPSVLSSVKVYAKQFFKSRADIDRIILALEEAVNNVLSYSVTDHMTNITVTADSADGKFTVCVLDTGLPGDYDETLKGDERLGLEIMQSSVDEFRVENLGFGGRRQCLIKYYDKLPILAVKDKSGDNEVIENAVITIRPPKREEILGISRAFYNEYGLTYLREDIYYPERFYACINKGQIYSTIAVDQNGGFAGHLASLKWDHLPGIWECSMAVVNGRYRGAGVFTKLMEENLRFMKNEANGKTYISCCVTSHPYSQKTHVKYNFFPCGFLFNGVPPDALSSSFLKEGQYTHEAYAAIVYDFSERTVYFPEELIKPASFIYNGLKLPRTLITDDVEPQVEHTCSTWSYSTGTRTGSVVISAIGKDYAKRLRSDVFELRTRGAEMISLNINVCTPGFVRLYEAAKAEGFFFTAVIPNAEMGDIFVMQKLLKKNVIYDELITVEPFTTMLEMIREFDPDQNQQ